MEEERSATREKRLSNKQEAPGRSDGRDSQGSRATMLMRSTGLGKAELVAEIVAIKRQGDYLIMEMQTTQPVRWKIRGGLSHRDLLMILKAMLKPSVFPFLLNLRGWFKKPEHPGDF